MAEPSPSPGAAVSPVRSDPSAAAWPYVLPFAAFLGLTALEGQLPPAPGGGPSPLWYPIGYTLKIVAVCVLAWRCRIAWRDLVPIPSAVVLGLSAAVGVLVIVAWVGLDGRYPDMPYSGKRTAFDPRIIPPAGRFLFLAVRLFGLVLVVPLIEELFYRSFLIRWVNEPDFTRIPVGTVTPLSLAVTAGLFAASHPEWLPALLTGIAWGVLVWKTKSVTACVVSHAVANLTLGIYVLVTNSWRFW